MAKLLYIGSYGRSGSTLLGRILGQAPGAICLGETRYLWSRGLTDNVECGCGVPFRECSFWSAVGERAFGGWRNLDIERLSEIDRRTNLLRAMPAYARATPAPLLRAAIREYQQPLTALYRAIGEVSGARVIVEISKDPTFACMLARIPDSDIRVVHLVRDSRAVAHSWTRRRREPSPIAGQQFMPRFAPGETATKWVAWNTALRALEATRRPYMQLNYESFVEEPESALSRIARFAGEDLAGGLRLTDEQVLLGPHHMFSGNPMRVSSGAVGLRVDNEWQAELPRRQFLAVTALTWPLLMRYGYRISRSPSTSRAASEHREGLARA